MSGFDPAAAEGFVKAHPVGSAIGGLAIVLVIWWALAGRSAAPAAAAATGSTDDSATTAATSIQNAQIAAGVANNQTAAQLTATLAGIQATTDASVAASAGATQVAYYGAATAISDNNLTTYQTGVAGGTTLNAQNDSTILSEFENLAALIASGQAVTAPGLTNGLETILGGQATANNASNVSTSTDIINQGANAIGANNALLGVGTPSTGGNALAKLGDSFVYTPGSAPALASNTGPDAHA